MKLLLTNDDGVFAPGLLALQEAAAALGAVTVVAPDRSRSGASHAVTLHKPLRVHPVTLANGAPALATNGTPADCVIVGCHAEFGGPPDLVLSGINDGPNLGEDITYSGTVSAAMESCLLGVPALALSVAGKPVRDFAPAARLTAALARIVLERGLPPDTFLNVNFPDCPEDELQGIEVTHKSARRYQGELERRVDPRGYAYYWVGGGISEGEQSAGSDAFAVAQRRVSITPVHLDLTHHALRAAMQSWNLDQLLTRKTSA